MGTEESSDTVRCDKCKRRSSKHEWIEKGRLNREDMLIAVFCPKCEELVYVTELELVIKS